MHDSFNPQEARAVADLKKDLANRFGDRLAAVTLYGSRARGDFDENSDIDIAIIVRALTAPEKNELLSMVAEIELTSAVALSTLVLSEHDFKLLQQRERRIARDITSEGIAL